MKVRKSGVIKIITISQCRNSPVIIRVLPGPVVASTSSVSLLPYQMTADALVAVLIEVLKLYLLIMLMAGKRGDILKT